MGKNIRQFKSNTSKSFNHECKYCKRIPVHFYPTKQPVDNIKLLDGTEYKIHSTGAWIRTSGRRQGNE